MELEKKHDYQALESKISGQTLETGYRIFPGICDQEKSDPTLVYSGDILLKILIPRKV